MPDFSPHDQKRVDLIYAMAKIRWIADMLEHNEDTSRFQPVGSCIKYSLCGAEFSVAFLRVLGESISQARDMVKALPQEFPLRKEALKRLTLAWESWAQLDVPASWALLDRDFAAARSIANDAAGKVASECGRAIRDMHLEFQVAVDDFDLNEKG